MEALEVKQNTKKVNILVVDDEETVCRSVENILNRAGHKTKKVNSAEDALHLLEDKKDEKFDLIITDLMMPRTNGMELTKVIKDRWPEIAVMIITGYASIPTAVESAQLGAGEYLPKPFTPQELTGAVEKALNPPARKEGKVIKINDTLSPEYCSLGKRKCKRFVSKGMCKTSECPIVAAERKKAGKSESIGSSISDAIDVDLPFSAELLESMTSRNYVNALGRSDMPVAGKWNTGHEVSSGKRILVVDDEAVIVNSIHKILTRKGYEVVEAFSGTEGLRKAAETPFDMLILDMKLGDENGIELISSFKEMQPELPIAIVTGYASVQTAVEAVKSGAKDYMAKPFTPDELYSLIFRVLAA